MNFGKIILFVLLQLIFLSSNISAEEKTYNTKPYEFVASEILQNKIVMLGENGALGHRNLFPYITTINIIDSWNNQLKQNNIHNRTLNLIVEKSPSMVKLIQQYIDKNDLTPFLNRVGNFYSLEDLYYCYKLKELNEKIKESKNKLKLVGFETDESYDNEYSYKYSKDETDFFFAKERDSLLFEDINSFVKKNPEDNFLIFYGSAHLVEEYVPKVNPTEKNDGKGYYLGHYLRNEFKDKFVTVDQSFLLKEDMNFINKTDYLKDKNFIVEKSDSIFLGKVPFTELKSDFTIIRHDGLVGPHLIRNVFSKNTLERNLTYLIEFEKLSNKYKKNFSLKYSENENILLRWIIQSMKLITGKEFNSIEEYKNYLSSTENKFYHNRIWDENFSTELLMQLKNNPQDREYRLTLYNLGTSYLLYLNQNIIPTEEEWKNIIWKEAQPHLNYFDYVGLFWLGTEFEKEKAKEFLTEFTKESYSEAAEYLEWYYKNKYNYNFE